MSKIHVIISFFIIAVLVSCDQHNATSTFSNETLIVTQPATDSLVFLNPASKSEITRLTLGKLPHNIRLSADGSTAYVVLVGSQAIAEIDIESQSVLRTFLSEATPTSGEDGQIIEAHLLEQANLHTSCFDCHNATITGVKPIIVGSRPFGIALTDDNQLIVANSASATLSFIDLSSGEISKTLNVLPANEAHEPTELAILNGVLYVSIRPSLPSSAAAELRAYDLVSSDLLYSTKVGSAVADLKVDIKSNTIYISNFESNTVEKYTPELVLLETLIVGNGPFGIDISDNDVLIANYYNNSVSVLSILGDETKTRNLQSEDRYFSNPTHISRSVDKDQFYLISGGTNGFLLTLDSKTLKVKSKQKIDGLAFDVMTLNNKNYEEDNE